MMMARRIWALVTWQASWCALAATAMGGPVDYERAMSSQSSSNAARLVMVLGNKKQTCD